MPPRLYFDYAATTPLDPRVREAMLPHLSEEFGNPSSLHAEGRAARAAVEQARGEVAALLGASPQEIVFTGSGTEADNLALLGSAAAADGGHIVTSAIEHPAVLETCHWLEGRGVPVSFVSPRQNGIVEPGDLAAAMRPDTRLVSIMMANNVVGTLQPISQLARIAYSAGALFHTDAVQAAGRVPLDVGRLGVDLLSISAHKFYGPKGVGALFVRAGVRVEPLCHGGGQERGLRPATENVAALAGMGCAARLALAEMGDEAVRLVKLREKLLAGILARVPGAYLHGDPHRRLPGHLCLGLEGVEGEAVHLLLKLDDAGVAASSGSACSSRDGDRPSHVLSAMGVDPVKARGPLRLSMGRLTSDAEVDQLLNILPGAVASLRPTVTRSVPKTTFC